MSDAIDTTSAFVDHLYAKHQGCPLDTLVDALRSPLFDARQCLKVILDPRCGLNMTFLPQESDLPEDLYSILLDDYDGKCTPLLLAVLVGRAEVLEELFHYGVSITSTLIHSAVKSRQFECLQIMLTEGADVNEVDEDDWTALHAAARESDMVEAIQLLLDSGADPNVTNEVAQHPLYFAARFGHCSNIEVLVHEGADVNAKNSDNDTALHAAAHQGCSDCVRLLIDQGSVVECMPSPLHLTVYNGFAECVQILIDHDAQVNALRDDTWKCTPLHWAVSAPNKCGRVETMEVLLAEGADVNSIDSIGQTPLYTGVQNNRAELVQLLADAGADTNAHDKLGWSPLRNAVNRQFDHCEVVLRAEGAIGPRGTAAFGDT